MLISQKQSTIMSCNRQSIKIQSVDSSTTEQSSTKSSPRSTDTPTPAKSRAFFREQETLLSQQTMTPTVTGGLSNKLPDNSKSLQETESLETLAHCLNDIKDLSSLDWAKFPVNMEQLLTDLREASGCLFTLISLKIEKCNQILQKVLLVESHTNRSTLPEQDSIILLIHNVIDMSFAIEMTGGIWDLTPEKQSSLGWQMDECLVYVRKMSYEGGSLCGVPFRSIAEFQKRVAFHTKTKSKMIPEDNTSTLLCMIAESLGRLTSWIVYHMHHYYLKDASFSDSSATQRLQESPGIQVLAHSEAFHCEGNPNHLQNQQQIITTFTPRLNATIAYIHTKTTIDLTHSLKQIFKASTLFSASKHLQNVCSGLLEIQTKQNCRWNSFLYRENNQHSIRIFNENCSVTTLQQWNSNTPGFSIREDKDTNEPIIFLKHQIYQFSQSLSAFQHFLGMILGGGYDNNKVQQELTHVIVFGSYISLVGFLFWKDLQYIIQWIQPHLSNIRQKLRGNVETSSTKKSFRVTKESAQPCLFSIEKTSLTALALFNLLSDSQNLNLTHQADSDMILSLFCPQYARRHSTLPSQREAMTAPATRINPLLAWLVWEGDIFQLYCELRQSNQDYGSLNKEIIEQSIYNAIIRGFQTIQAKFSLTFPQFFEINSKEPDLHEGNAVLNFCQRGLECLKLCHLGEVDLGATRKVFLNTVAQQPEEKIPSLHHCIAAYIGTKALMQKPDNISTKITEALPKLIWTFLHQSVFHCSPIYTAYDDRVRGSITHQGKSSLVRINSLLAMLDCRTTLIQSANDAILNNLDTSQKAVNSLNERIQALETKIQSSLTFQNNNAFDSTDHLTVPLHTTPESQEDVNKRCGGKQNLEISKELDKENHQGAHQHCSPTLVHVIQRNPVVTHPKHTLGPTPLNNHISNKPDENPCVKGELPFASKQLVEEACSEINQLKTQVAHLNHIIRELKDSLVKDLIERTKKEMSVYLTQTLSKTIQNHIALALEKQQKKIFQRRRSRLLPWASPRKSWEKDPSFTNKETDRSNRGPRRGFHLFHNEKEDNNLAEGNQRGFLDQKTKSFQTQIWRGFDIDADTVSVMEEHEEYDPIISTNKTGWFDCTMELLEMPDPGIQEDTVNQLAPLKKCNRASF